MEHFQEESRKYHYGLIIIAWTWSLIQIVKEYSRIQSDQKSPFRFLMLKFQIVLKVSHMVKCRWLKGIILGLFSTRIYGSLAYLSKIIKVHWRFHYANYWQLLNCGANYQAQIRKLNYLIMKLENLLLLPLMRIIFNQHLLHRHLILKMILFLSVK